MADERLRLFVAVDVPADRMDAVDKALVGLRTGPPDIRWVRPEGRHLTLKFLGWTDADLLGPIRLACGEAAGRHPGFTLSLLELGCFPSPRRVRVLWVGLDDPAGALAALATDLEKRLEPLGFEAEKRAFSPHVTLGRLRTPAPLPELPGLPTGAGKPFSVDRLVLYRSRLSPAGARYEVLDSFVLKGERSQ